MKIHEYQAKEILRKYGILVPPGKIASTPTEARQIARELKSPLMIKAQIHAGGRGKGGGVKKAVSLRDAERIAAQMLGKRLVTAQTSPEGVLVDKVLVQQAIEIEEEFYLAIVMEQEPVIMLGRGGGDVEEIALQKPETLLRKFVNLNMLDASVLSDCWELASRFVSDSFLSLSLGWILLALFRIFRDKECLLVEINPLALSQNRFWAVDAKMVFDDNALFRHPEMQSLQDLTQLSPLEATAHRYGINYIPLEGNIACIGNGAGLTMATLDGIKEMGEKPGSFLDLGGGATPESIEHSFRIALSDPSINVILLNIVAGIFRFDILAPAIRKALDAQKSDALPHLVMRLSGNKADEGRKALRDAGIEFQEADTMEDALRKAVYLSQIDQGGQQ